jgi:hypothetical protein
MFNDAGNYRGDYTHEKQAEQPEGRVSMKRLIVFSLPDKILMNRKARKERQDFRFSLAFFANAGYFSGMSSRANNPVNSAGASVL